MAENEVIENETTVEEDYIQTIQDLKANTVPKDDYQQLKQEHQKLLKAIVNGDKTDGFVASEAPKDAATLRKELFTNGENLNALDFVKTTLELRKAVIDEGGVDPFLPYGVKILPDESDVEAANRVASVFQECVDCANGCSDVFTNELTRRIVDTAPTINNKKRK